MNSRTKFFGLSLLAILTVACDSASSAPPPSASSKGKKSGEVETAASKGGLDPKDPLAAFLDDGEDKSPGEIRDNQVNYLWGQVEKLNSQADSYDRECFRMSTSMIRRETGKLILPSGANTGAGSAVAGIGALGVGLLSGSLSGDWGSALGDVGGDAGKYFGDGVSAEINRAAIKQGVGYINDLEASDMATCQAKVKNIKAKVASMVRQINDLRNLGTE